VQNRERERRSGRTGEKKTGEGLRVKGENREREGTVGWGERGRRKRENERRTGRARGEGKGRKGEKGNEA